MTEWFSMIFNDLQVDEIPTKGRREAENFCENGIVILEMQLDSTLQHIKAGWYTILKQWVKEASFTATNVRLAKSSVNYGNLMSRYI